MHYQTLMDEAQGRIFPFVSIQTFAAKKGKDTVKYKLMIVGLARSA